MSTHDHAPSYYAASARPTPAYPALAGAVDCDVCVVGGGIAGCSAALHLAERGYSVVLLEARQIGWGASGRSGGQAIHGVASGQHKLIRLIGPGPARQVWDMSVEALALIRSLIGRFQIECDWADGWMLTAIKPRHERELLAELAELRKDYAYPYVRHVERAELRGMLGTERYLSALLDSNSGHLHPLNYALGLGAAAASRGVRIFEGTRALGFQRSAGGAARAGAAGAGDGPVRVRTAQGAVNARHLVLCGNVYLGATAPQLAARIMAVATYIVATERLAAARARELIAHNVAVSDMNWVLDYFRLSADHRLLFGGRVNYSGLSSFDAPSATRLRMLKVFPQLADVKIEYAWGGEVDITLNRAPDFGRLAPNIYYLQGFSGHGIALTGLAGKLVAEAIAGTAERFDVFARIPHAPFPGGQLMRRPALVLAMLWYRIRDLL